MDYWEISGVVRVHLTLGNDYTQPSRADLAIIVSAQGKLVQFTRAEQMVCNGVTLTRFVGAFEAQFSVADIAGHSLSCTYTSGSTVGTLTGDVPTIPTFLAPQNGDQVTRSIQTAVRYTPMMPPFHIGTKLSRY